QTSEAASKDPNHLIEYHLGRNPTFDPRRNDETHDHPSHLTPAFLGLKQCIALAEVQKRS
ncbi:unnamed protein product, partial [Cyprideis torosa]